MINGLSVIAIIPARAGSKRLPGKNKHELNGQPLIGWTFDAALESEFIDQILLTTDDPALADLAQDRGIAAPFLRPEHLATDEASSEAVIQHALDYLHETKQRFDLLVLLQPTSPLRTSRHIDQALQRMMQLKSRAIIGVCAIGHPIEWANELTANGYMDHFVSNMKGLPPSKALPQRYRINGAIYAAYTEDFIRDGSFLLSSQVASYIMPRMLSVDIDTVDDLMMAECFMRHGGKHTADS
jgi:CMP-N-acetylneuraminic acid synthetase